MRIRYWSSDVCSSVLSAAPVRGHRRSASDGGRRTRECERTDHSYDGRGNGSNDSSFCCIAYCLRHGEIDRSWNDDRGGEAGFQVRRPFRRLETLNGMAGLLPLDEAQARLLALEIGRAHV